jgi:hypothetical protein
MTAEDRLIAEGYEGVVIFDNRSYDAALIGVSEDGRAIYDYEKMVDGLMYMDGMMPDEAVEWIEYNTIRALPYMAGAPIIMYPV